MKTKEEIIKSNAGIVFDFREMKNHEPSMLKAIKRFMDIYAEQEAIEFFKWYGAKMAGLLLYINTIRQTVKSDEIEEKIVEHEGSSLDQLYDRYLKSKIPPND